MKYDAEWLTDKYICLMLLVFPLWTGFEGYAALTVSKYGFFVAATGLWLLGLVLRSLSDPAPLPKPRPSLYCALAFMAAVTLSALLSPHLIHTIVGAGRYDGLLTLLLYGCIFIGVSLFGRPRRLYAHLAGLSCLACCAVALLQLGDVNALGLFPNGLSYYDSGVEYSGEFLGTIGNVDVLSAYFALCVPLFIALPVVSRRRRDLWLLLPAALCLYVLFRSRVASGFAALAVGPLFCVPYLASVRGGRRLTVALAGVSAALALAGLALLWFWPADSGTLWEISQTLRGNAQDSFGSSRIMIWRESLELIRERPLLGGGPDTLTLRSSLGFSRYVTETGRTLSSEIDNAHNEFLGYLVNTGLLGLLGYLSVLTAAAASAVRNRRRDQLTPALACGVVCYLISSFFGLGLCLVVPLLWIYAGLLCSSGEGENERSRAE